MIVRNYPPTAAILASCCAAAAATPGRVLRPRRPDRRLLARIEDAGCPAPRNRVWITPLVQATHHAPGVVMAEGVWWPPIVEVPMTSFLIEHPDARIMVDPSICEHVHRDVLAGMPAPVRRLVSPDQPVTGMAAALAPLGLTPNDIDLTVATHLHWDHISGLTEIPTRTPLVTTAVEREFALAATTPLAVATAPLQGRTFDVRELDGPPVYTFASSHDLMGDGSILLVDLAGHTPGSVGVLVSLTDGRTVLLCGDAAYTTTQITRIRGHAPLPGRLFDHDPDAAFATLHRLHALPRAVTAIPGHDRAAINQLNSR